MPLTELSELKAWRNKYGISQEKLAKISGLGVNTIAKVETGAAHLQGQTTTKLLKAVEEYEATAALTGVSAIDVTEADDAAFQIGELRNWRTSYGISQEKLAQLSGLGVNTIAKIETGATQIMPQTARKLRQIVRQVETGEIPMTKTDSTVDHMAGFDPNELKAWRKKHGISQEKLAKSANLGVNTILKLEAGSRVEKKTLLTLMQAVREINKGIKAAAAEKASAAVAAPAPAPAPVVAPVVVPVASAVPAPKPVAAAKVPAKPTPAPKSTGLSFGANFDLKTWRKRFNLSQGKLADLAQLSLNTVMKMESGAKDVQKRTIERLLSAIKAVEDKVTVIPVETPKPATPVAAPVVAAKPPVVATPAPVVAPAPAVVHTPVASPAPVLTKATPSQAAPLQLSNLDLELINRVILMSTKQKLRMLALMMDEESAA